MIKTQNIDTELLDQAIIKSGLKTNYICETLGISRQAFDKKRKGKVAFRKAEVYVLSKLLRLSEDQEKKIFCLVS